MKKISKYVLISILLCLVIVGCIFFIRNKKIDNNIIRDDVDENGIPYLLLEYEDYKIKSSNYDFSKLFDDSYTKPITAEEFNNYWNIFEEQDIITINDYNIYNMFFSSSNGKEFSVEEYVSLQYKEENMYASYSKGIKDMLILSNKEKGNNITVGISSSNAENYNLKIYRINYDDIGDVYYAFRFKCIKKI